MYNKIKPELASKYLKNRSKKHDGYLEQVIGEEKVKEMAKVWKDHGETLTYISEILEYQYILDCYPSKEQAELIADIFSIQNTFLKNCQEKVLVDREDAKSKETEEQDY